MRTSDRRRRQSETEIQKMRIAVVAVFVLVLVLILLPGCVWSVDELKAESAFLKAETARLQIELDAVAANDPLQAGKVAAIQGQLDKLAPHIQTLDDLIAKMDAAGGGTLPDWLEIAALIAAGFIPGGAVAVPFIRTARRSLDHVFESVRRGGGVVNPEGAKMTLKTDSATYLRFLKWKADQP